MAHTIEDIGPSSKKIIFSFERFDIENLVQGKLAEFQKEMDLKGFRKGKVPLSIVEQRFRPEAEKHALDNFFQKQYDDFLRQEPLAQDIIGRPIIENVQYTSPDEPGSFEIIVDVFPVLDFECLDHLTFDVPKVSVSAEELEKSKEYLCTHNSELRNVPEELTLFRGAYASLNMEVFNQDGVCIRQLNKENILIKIPLEDEKGGDFLTTDITVPQLPEKLLGMKRGEIREISWVLPEKSSILNKKGVVPRPTANQLLTLKLSLVEIKEFYQPNFSDEKLLEKLGYKTENDCIEALKKQLIQQKTAHEEEVLNEKIVDAIVEKLEIDVPPSLLLSTEEEVKGAIKAEMKDSSAQEIEDFIQKNTADIQTEAVRQGKRFVVMRRLYQYFDIKIGEEDLDGHCEQLSSKLQQSGHANYTKDFVKGYFTSNRKERNEVLSKIAMQRLLQKLRDRV
ncbi:MAG: hypothetical protein HQK53_15000, partial [Oligoflexia bacterium]|nr:hypothetical protein [Oligoflexia bacterium]